MLEELLDTYFDDLSTVDFYKGYQLLSSYYNPPEPFTHDAIDMATLEEIRYYARFAMAIYGWKLLSGAFSVHDYFSFFSLAEKEGRILNDDVPRRR